MSLESFSPFTFNEDQKIAAGLLEKFLDDAVDRVFILSGHAGTGKTSMIQAPIRYAMDKKVPVVLLASTGRAAKVVAEKAGYTAETVHKHIYQLAVDETDDEKKMKKLIFKLRPNLSPENALYIVDESSMISDHHTESVFIKFGTGKLMTDLFLYTGDRKVVFVGDPAQLPPVNTLFPPSLTPFYLRNTHRKTIARATLEAVMRHRANSGISYNTGQLRKIIEGNQKVYMKIKASGFNDISLHFNPDSLVSEYVHSIREYGLEDNIFVCFSNALANQFNEKVRDLLFPNKKGLQKKELLMVVMNNYKFDITNGEQIVVDWVNKQAEHLAGLTFRDFTGLVKDVNGYRTVTGKLLEDVLYSRSPSLSNEQEWALYKDFMIRIHRKGVRPKTPEFLAELISDPWLNAIRARFGYAVTCHKAQGGEWERAFVVFEPSLFMQDKVYQHRWAYTAISRGMKELHLLDNRCIE
jgi:ATP-dependent exoDNAse (exonuclease V) alpha subunit